MNLVQKYDGQCLCSPEMISAVARHTATVAKTVDRLVIVTSPMGSLAENLIAEARKVTSDVSGPELSSLLSGGDQRTAAILAMALNNLGVPAQSMSGFSSRTRSDDFHRGINLIEYDTKKVEDIVDTGKVAVVSGFLGNDSSDPGSLKRGGCDITATAIAAHLECPCEIYTQKDCIYTVDPDVYPQARPLQQLCYDELMEMSNLGADVIETGAVELAKKYNIPLFLGKSLEDKSKGTRIMDRENLIVEDMPISTMSIQEDIAIFTLNNLTNDGKTVADCFNILGELDINVDMISQHVTGPGSCALSFSCSSEQGRILNEQIAGNGAFAGVEIECQDKLAMISLIGVGMATHSGVASKVFRVLADNDISYYHITTSEISISITVDMSARSKAAIALSQTFDL